MLTISPGHFGVGTGASGYIDEVQEARKVVKRVAALLKAKGVTVNVVEDNYSLAQQENLRYLVTEHNKTVREWDVSIHFNASKGTTNSAIGTEVLYLSTQGREKAAKISNAIASAGKFLNRGPKKRTDIKFLNETNKPALVIEVCFVNSLADVKNYEQYFEEICTAVAEALLDANHPVQSPNFSSPSLEARIHAIWENKTLVEKILQEGIQDGVFNPLWLEQWKKGELTLTNFLALCALQQVAGK